MNLVPIRPTTLSLIRTTPRPAIVCVVIGLLGFFAAARAQEITLVVPPGFEDTEGNAVANPIAPHPDPGGGDNAPDGVRWQLLYLAEYFSSVGPGPFAITNWAGRPDVSVDEPVLAEYEYTVNLTTTEIDSLADSFVGNYGSSGIATTVFSGTVSEETDGVARPGGLPHDFDYGIEFEKPYVYDPLEGNLLVELISTTNYTTRPIWRDFHDFGLGPNLFAFADDPAAVTTPITAQVIQIAQFTFATALCDPNSQGDLDGNGVVEFDDFLALAANFGNAVADHTFGDIDCDGVVEFDDFLALAANFGNAVPAATASAVPEPAGFALFGVAGLLVGPLRRRRS